MVAGYFYVRLVRRGNDVVGPGMNTQLWLNRQRGDFCKKRLDLEPQIAPVHLARAGEQRLKERPGFVERVLPDRQLSKETALGQAGKK